MSTKMKGVLKGLRYISQIFDNEKEQEIQIGYPTDVKHVAHIGWDGPASASSAPSWMNEFKSSSGFSSAPLGAPTNPQEDGAVKWTSEGMTLSIDTQQDHSYRGPRALRVKFPELNRRGGSLQSFDSPARDLPENLPKSSRRQSSAATSSGSPTKLKSERSRHSRKSAKGSQSPARDLADPALGSSSPARPDIPKKTRRKKSKESSVGGGSSRSSTRSKGQPTSQADESPFPETGVGSRPPSMPKNSDEKAMSRIS